MRKLLFLLLFIPFVSFGQDYGNSNDAIKLCTVLQSNNFSSDAEAEAGLNKILNVIGASKSFILQPCSDINNAVAATYKGRRYILYDRNFMNSINSGNNWANLFILAHEVGHHINGHSLDLVLYASDAVEPATLKIKRNQELEADEFGGFVLAKLGGPISAANEIINKIANNDDDTYSTHPSKQKRIDAIKKGYNRSKIFSLPYVEDNSDYILLNNNYEQVQEWENIVSDVKENKLKRISDPFQRSEIIDDENTPNKTNTSWTYGSILDVPNDSILLKPKLIVIQERFIKKNQLKLLFNNSFFAQVLSQEIDYDKRDRLRQIVFVFDFLFDDGTKGIFESKRHDWDMNREEVSQSTGSNTLWEIWLRDLNGKNNYSDRGGQHSYFIRLMKGKKVLFIKLNRAEQEYRAPIKPSDSWTYKTQKMYEKEMQEYNANEVLIDIINSKSSSFKTHSFDLRTAENSLTY